MSQAKAVCAIPGCPNLAWDRHTNRGYCDAHASVAVVDALEDIGGYLDQLVNQTARIAEQLEQMPAPRDGGD